jgi:phospholipid/cholesterol/gamma-HCH transport system substrate-binding protein
MRTTRHSARKVVFVGLVLALLAGTALVVLRDRPARPTVVAMFADASPLRVGNTVQAHGVKIGQIRGISLDHGSARVVLRLDEKVPVHTDARATIRPVSLLGERYVDLDAGTDTAPLAPDGGVIPLARTASSVDLDQVLDSLDDPTSTALAAMVTTLGTGVTGNGKNLRDALAAVDPALRRTDRLVDILNQQNTALNSLVDLASPVAAAVASNKGADLDGMVDRAQQTLGTVAAKREQLTASLTELPGSLEKARRTFYTLGGLADQLTPTLHSLRPLTGNLRDVATELHSFADAADPAVTSLGPVLTKARSMLDEARPVAADLHEGSGDLRGASQGLRAVGGTLADQMGNVVSFLTGWALCTNGYDSVGHYFRAYLTIDRNTAGKVLPDLLPGSAEAIQRLAPLNRPPDTGLDKIGGRPPDQAPPPVAPPLLGGALSGQHHQPGQPTDPPPVPGEPWSTPKSGPGSGGDTDATGLTPAQEGDMFDQLLGGGK